MKRLILPLASALATITAAVLVRAEESGRPVPQSAGNASWDFTSPIPLILQEGDGEHLVRRAGPTGGWPFIIKLDSQNGDTKGFLVLTETMAPGQTIPFHKHDNAEEILILEEGGATVIVGGKQGMAGPRSIVYVPAQHLDFGYQHEPKRCSLVRDFLPPGIRTLPARRQRETGPARYSA